MEEKNWKEELKKCFLVTEEGSQECTDDDQTNETIETLYNLLTRKK